MSLWNGNKICTQRNRQHVLSGILMDLYHKQDVRNWGVPLGCNEESNDREAFRTILTLLQDCDINSFLLEEIAAWCTRELSLLGLSKEIDNS